MKREGASGWESGERSPIPSRAGRPSGIRACGNCLAQAGLGLRVRGCEKMGKRCIS